MLHIYSENSWMEVSVEDIANHNPTFGETLKHNLAIGLPVAFALSNGHNVGIILDDESFTNTFIKFHEFGHLAGGHHTEGKVVSPLDDWDTYIRREMYADEYAIRQGASKELAISTLRYLYQITVDLLSRGVVSAELAAASKRETEERIKAIEEL